MAAVLSLAACTPAGRAVGDTQDSMPEVAHDSTHPTDVTVGFVGSTDTAADEFVINALSDDKLKCLLCLARNIRKLGKRN